MELVVFTHTHRGYLELFVHHHWNALRRLEETEEPCGNPSRHEDTPVTVQGLYKSCSYRTTGHTPWPIRFKNTIEICLIAEGNHVLNVPLKCQIISGIFPRVCLLAFSLCWFSAMIWTKKFSTKLIFNDDDIYTNAVIIRITLQRKLEATHCSDCFISV